MLRCCSPPFPGAIQVVPYFMAVVLTGLVASLRFLLDPILGDRTVFIFFVFPTYLVTWWWGWKPAAFAVVLGFVVANYCFVHPRNSFAVDQLFQVISLSCYLIVAGTGIFAIDSLRTALKRLEKRSEDRFAQAIESSPNAMVMVDADGKILLLNTQMEQLFDYRRDELLGQPVELLIPERFRDPHPQLRQSFLANPQFRPMGLGRDLRARRKDGTEFAVEIGLNPIKTDQGMVVLSAIVDITQRKKAEDMFRQAVESAPAGMVMIDAVGKIVLVNAQTERLFGYRRDELLGQRVEILVPERFRLQHPENRSGFFANPKARSMGVGRDLFGRHKSGAEFAVEIGLNPISTDQGLLVMSAIVDITERKRSENAIRSHIKKLADANIELTARTTENEAFVYSVSHDLRSPLVNLQGFSKELTRSLADLRAHIETGESTVEGRDAQRGILDGPMTSSIRFIQTAVTRLSNIINALLQLSRAGRVVYQGQKVEVSKIVARIVDSMHATIGERKATVRVDELPAAWGDPAAIEQIFANLIGNALNYLDKRRPGEISIGSLPANADSAGRIVYFIRDNGLGIAETGHSKIFQPFQRLHPQAAPGEGMGLAIIYRVVERLGGRIWFMSPAGQGTTFFVSLPETAQAEPDTAVHSGNI